MLLRMLTPQQQESLIADGQFLVTGGTTGAEYAIFAWRQINIVDLTNLRRLCYVIPKVPLYDQLLAQKLLLEGDEQRLLDVALVWSY